MCNAVRHGPSTFHRLTECELSQKLTDRRVTEPDYPTGNVLEYNTKNQNLFIGDDNDDDENGPGMATGRATICNTFVDVVRKSFKHHR